MNPTPREIFERQIDCIRRGDRAGQLKLYADDVVYRFPFATDRPRVINGVEQFRQVMEPLWNRARAAGIKIVGYEGEAHQVLDDPELLFAEFTLTIDAGGESSQLEFVQKMRVRNGRIVAATEYFNALARERIRERS